MEPNATEAAVNCAKATDNSANAPVTVAVPSTDALGTQTTEEDLSLLQSLPKKNEHNPTAIVVVGMAGAGKTTFVTALYAHLVHKLKKRVYAINLDPAVDNVPFPANIDIRDTIKYKDVMKHYSLGPNGAILTSLNLYATRFDQVLGLIEKRKSTIDYVLVDTPGQIEVFNWSASGTIILDSLAVSIPTEIAFLIDSVRCQRPTTFVANLMYACSVMYKTKLPFIGVFTKTDLIDPEKQMQWLSDPNEFVMHAEDDGTYAFTLAKSCAAALSRFYETFPRVPVSVIGNATETKGFDQFKATVDDLVNEYHDTYLGWILQERERIKQEKHNKAQAEAEKFDNDCDEDSEISD